MQQQPRQLQVRAACTVRGPVCGRLILRAASDRTLTKDQYCGGTAQACKKDGDCLSFCYADCYPCNDKSDCDTLVAFGLVADEGDTACFSIYTADRSTRFQALIRKYRQDGGA